MSDTKASNESIERRSLETGKWANLLMALAGVVAAFASHSDALLVDGLYSGVNFVSAIIAARVSALVARPPDRRYPFGYDAYEALYVNYRSLVLLGVMAFALFNATSKIIVYVTTGEAPELVFGPIVVYMVLMVAICFGLAFWHRHNWQRSGKKSQLLVTESRAAVIDGAISAGAGGGLLASALLRGTPLEGIVPVSDSIIVIIMCGLIVGQPIGMFRSALKEIAGAAADEAIVKKARTAIGDFLASRPYALLDVAVTKLGRGFYVLSFVRPDGSIDGATADRLWKDLDSLLGEALGSVKTELVIAEQPPFHNE